MYNTPYFNSKSEKEIIDFMHQHPFVIITGCDANNFPVATHVPVLIEEREGKLFLVAHIKRQTDHHKAFLHNPKILAIFSGAHAYVSASWYTDKQQASTWNYQAVHVKGTLRFLDDDGLASVLQRLTTHFEKDPCSPSLMEHLPATYVSPLMKAIVAFEIEVTDIQHIFKLSQNKNKESFQNIIGHLRKGDAKAQAIASAMERNNEYQDN